MCLLSVFKYVELLAIVFINVLISSCLFFLYLIEKLGLFYPVHSSVDFADYINSFVLFISHKLETLIWVFFINIP